MRFRIDFTLMPNARISIFRQNLINDNSTPIKMSITNLTKNELARGFKNLITQSDFYCDNNILKKGANGFVGLCIYDTPKKMPAFRNVTFSDFIGAKDYTCKILDTNEIDKDNVSYFDPSIDITQYLNAKGNPNNINKKPTKEEKVEHVEEAPKEEVQEIEDVKIIDNVKDAVSDNKEEQKIEEVQEVEQEEEKICCPVEGCDKEYSTKKGYKNHMKKVHGIEV